MNKLLCTVSALLVSTTSFATVPNISIDGSVPGQIDVYASERDAISYIPQKKDISYMHVSLSPQAKAAVAAAASKYLNNPFTCSRDDAKQLGMGGVPVFDQGVHGTCVTFAVSAAIDATYGVGDYISQLCNLQLGTYLHEQDASYPSGWNGSFSSTVIGQIRSYGVITMASQVLKGCSGKYVYPKGQYTSVPLSIDDFTARSVYILDKIETNFLLSLDNAFTSRDNGDALLTNLKTALKAGHRVVISTLLDAHTTLGSSTQGKYSIFNNDSWIITPEIERHAKAGMLDAAHALVATGFDDQAVITGPDNTKHKGVVTLRNSWGLMAGDFGAYYMSYDYFKAFVFDAVEFQGE